MSNKIKKVTVSYPQSMNELNERYGKTFAKIIMSSLNNKQRNELINEIESK